MLPALNYFCVFIYGFLIMTFLLDIKMNRRNSMKLILFAVISISVQAALFLFFGSSILEKAYPLIVHLPLLVFYMVCFQKRMDHVLFVLCTAYILTAPRRWLGDLIALPFHSDPMVAALSSILLSIALLFITYRYVRPYFIKTFDFSQGKFNMIGIVPLVYYVLSYLTTVYTNLLYTSRVIVIGILTTGLAIVFYYFLIAYIDQLTKRFTLQNEQNVLAVQIASLKQRAEAMQDAQEQTRIYRHDMRHHLGLINAYLADNNREAAQKYIAQITSAIEDTVVPRYCENYTVNLILYSCILKAESEGIQVQTKINLSENKIVSDMDLCVVFSNAIENAVNACKKLIRTEDRKLLILCNIEDSKLLIRIMNTFDGQVRFEDGIPVSTEQNHGLGIKSILGVVDKYHGLCSFTSENGQFCTSMIL